MAIEQGAVLISAPLLREETLRYRKVASEDIEAVIAYLRTLAPIERDVPPSEPDFPVNLIMRTMPEKPVLRPVPDKSDAVAYGEYLVTAASCFDCHTKFDDGKYIGPPGGGGRVFRFPNGAVLRSSNLTPQQTGIVHLSKEDFVRLFKRYADPDFQVPVVTPDGFQSLMPWIMYGGMSEEDLGAIYEYLRSLPPYEHPVERFSPGT